MQHAPLVAYEMATGQPVPSQGATRDPDDEAAFAADNPWWHPAPPPPPPFVLESLRRAMSGEAM